MNPHTRKKIETWMRMERIGFVPHAVLFYLSLFYGGAVRLRLFLYKTGLFGSEKLPCRVISVGNITSGGTGKTPVVIHIAELLRKSGGRPVVLSRGYKGTSSGVSVVSDGKEILLGPEEAGDEPYLIAKRLKGVPVVIGKDRFKAGLFAVERFSPDCIILDDGFQHIRLKRDIDILLVDAGEGFGNRYLLPRGVLREPLGGIKRADVIIVKGGELRSTDKNELKRFDKPSFILSYRPSGLFSINGWADKGLDSLKGRKVVTLSGIANPDSFFKTVEGLKAKIVGKIVYPDHHPYTDIDIDALRASCKDADMIVTTEKDGVRLKGLSPGDLPLYALGIDAFVEDRKRFGKLILGGRG